MKLIWFQLNGFKKFGEPSKMNLDSKVIAILGKNEAGKTSFLEGLEHLDSDKKFITSGISQELTRDRQFKRDDKIIEAGFLLEDNDLNLLEQVHEGKKVRWIIVSKHSDGEIFWEVSPRPKRDLKPRESLQELLNSPNQIFSSLLLEYDETGKGKDPIPTLIKLLEAKSESLPKESVGEFEKLKEQILSTPDDNRDATFGELITRINEFLVTELSDPPVNQVIELLDSRIPSILRFTEEDRLLTHAYDLSPEAATPKALQNFALLAKLDLALLKQAISIDDQAKIEDLENSANRELKVVFEENWSQSGVSAHLRVNARVLHIQIEEANSPITSIAERSDGLRYYVALLAFVSRTDTNAVKPILLIDEAETHLHYDAQADLVQMFAKQDLASKVVFTTHSIGCLPEDLGNGVRIIESTKDNPNRSTVKNWFWESNEPGFSPLLFGMGARTLAFIPVRKALFAEGPADFILLPALLKEANNRSFLGFQVVPGLSIIKAENVPLMDNEAAKVAYLVDADDGGDAIVEKLRGAGITEDRIMRLPKIQNKNTVLEDLIDLSVYTNAINRSLRHWHGENMNIPETDFPETGRSAFVDNWCKNKGIALLSKREIAYRVLDEASTKEIVSETVKNDLVELFKNIKKVLEIKG